MIIVKKVLFLWAAFFVISSTFIFVSAQNIETSKSVYAVNTVLSLDCEKINGELIEVCQINDGSMVAVGSSGFSAQDSPVTHDYKVTGGDGSSTALAVKYNSDGKVEFLKTFGGNGMDRYNNVIALSDGGFLASGYSGSYEGGDFDRFGIKGEKNDGCAFMVKYDSDCNALWALSGDAVKLHHFVNIAENKNGEINALGYHIENNGTVYYSLRLTPEGNFVNGAYQKIPVSNSTVDSFVYDGNGFLYVCGQQTNTDPQKCDGYVSKYSPEGNLIFTKIFEGNGYERCLGLEITSDGNILVNGGYVRSSSGKSFDEIGAVRLNGGENSGFFVVKYTPEGNIIGGDVILNKGDSSFDLGRRLISIEDGEALFHCTFEGGFEDPLSGTKIAGVPQQGIFYRISAEGKYKYMYVVSSELFIGIYDGVASIRQMNDGSFRILSYENGETSRMRVFDMPDKFYLQETIDSTEDLQDTEYSEEAWTVFTRKLYYANQINISYETTQSEVNEAVDGLKNAIKNLSAGSGGNESQTDGDNISSEPLSGEIDKNTKSDSNGIFMFIVIGIFVLGAAAAGGYILFRKKHIREKALADRITMTIEEAKEYFISMGCSGMNMSRGDPDKYAQYKALNISASLEKQWVTESFVDKYDKVLNGQYSESLWCRHSACTDHMYILKSKDYYSKMLNLTRFVASKEVDGHKVVIAETINGRLDNKFRDGLIYGSYDCSMDEEAKEFAKIAFWLADNDKEPVPNENFWSTERICESRRKTESILNDLKLTL